MVSEDNDMSNSDLLNMSPEEKIEFNKLCLDTIREYSSDTVYFKDKNSKFLWTSRAHAKQVGAENPLDMIGKDDFDYFPREFAEKARADEVQIMTTGEPILNIPEELYHDEDNVEYLLASKYPLYRDGEIIGIWGITRNITEQKRLEKELERSYQKVQRLTRVDDLSGLYNRRYFYESLERTISIYDRREGDDTFTLVAIDVDNMTELNDRYGQLQGDNVLRHVASAMMIGCRKSDTCFRTGGDEFMIMLPDCDTAHAIGIAKKIADNVSSEAVPMGDNFVKVTVSVGIAAYQKGMDISELISLADRKLYKSKRNGKNQVSF